MQQSGYYNYRENCTSGCYNNAIIVKKYILFIFETPEHKNKKSYKLVERFFFGKSHNVLSCTRILCVKK